MDNLIAHIQTAYIKGRIILDNMVCAHETLHSIRIHKIKYFYPKLILKKLLSKSIGISY
jgi:hypothetical protein